MSGIITYKGGSTIKLMNFLFDGSYRLFYRTFFGILRVMDLIKGHLVYSCPSLKSIACIFDKPNLLTEKTNLPNLRVMGLIAGYRLTMPYKEPLMGPYSRLPFPGKRKSVRMKKMDFKTFTFHFVRWAAELWRSKYFSIRWKKVQFLLEASGKRFLNLKPYVRL